MLIVVMIGIGIWLPNYLILEKGVNLSANSADVFKCLTRSANWSEWGASWAETPAVFEIRQQIFLPQLGFAQAAVIKDIVNNEYLNLQGENSSLSFVLEDEDQQTWLSMTLEEKLGNNPLKKLSRHFFNATSVAQLTRLLAQISKTCQARK